VRNARQLFARSASGRTIRRDWGDGSMAGRIIVSGDGVGMSNNDAQELTDQLFNKKVYERSDVLICIKCKNIIDKMDESVISHSLCEKCYKELTL
jgi:hypothetical protein